MTARPFLWAVLCALALALPGRAGAVDLQPAPTPTPTPGAIPPGLSSGEPHLLTPDGLHYDFQAVGEFVLAVAGDDFAVQVRQEPWGTSTAVSANTAVAMNVAGDRVGLYVGATPRLHVAGQPTDLADAGTLALPHGGRVARQSDGYTVTWPDQTAVEVIDHVLILDVVVRLAPARHGQVAGLLGNADGDPSNDLAARDGSVIDSSGLDGAAASAPLYTQFGDSWRATQAESLFDYGPGQDTATYVRRDFPSAPVGAADLAPDARTSAEATCRQAGVANGEFLDNCVFDVGLTGDPVFAASAAAAQIAAAGAAPPLPTTLRFAGDTADLGIWFGPSQAGDTTQRVVQAFHAEVDLDVAGAKISGGAFSYVLVVSGPPPGIVQQEATVWTDVHTYDATEAGGVIVKSADGAVGGEVHFTGSLKIACQPAPGRDCTDTEDPAWTLDYGFVVDDEGRLRVCRTVDFRAAPSRQTCLDTAFAVLSPA